MRATGPPPRKRRPRARHCYAESGKEASGLWATNTRSPEGKQAISLELRPCAEATVV